jgi:hypothetical protein
MDKRQVSFPITDNRQFKSDQLNEEDLRFKVASLERELLKLQSINSNLKKSLDSLLLTQINDLAATSSKDIVNYSMEQQRAVASQEKSWGARYQSRNAEVKDIAIPDFAEPDHVYTNDTMDIIIEKACACDDISKVKKKNLSATEDMITRKLVLTRERNIHFDCDTCGENAHHKMIEKHIEAELYCKSE